MKIKEVLPKLLTNGLSSFPKFAFELATTQPRPIDPTLYEHLNWRSPRKEQDLRSQQSTRSSSAWSALLGYFLRDK